jgi:hypothetical protein
MLALTAKGLRCALGDQTRQSIFGFWQHRRANVPAMAHGPRRKQTRDMGDAGAMDDRIQREACAAGAGVAKGPTRFRAWLEEAHTHTHARTHTHPHTHVPNHEDVDGSIRTWQVCSDGEGAVGSGEARGAYEAETSDYYLLFRKDQQQRQLTAGSPRYEYEHQTVLLHTPTTIQQ